MQTNILWSGIEYNSLENCLVRTTDMGAEINSVIVGGYGEKIYRVEYQIRTNQNWETIFVEIKSQHSNIRDHFAFQSDAKGNWALNGKSANQFQGCIDVDIPLTPFTNTLPIKRLNTQKGEESEIYVLYIDLLERQITPVRQKYIRLSDTQYHYENIPNDFEANIEVDELGYVVDYPTLFTRTASVNSNFPNNR
jgi:hypothetical protein